MQTHELTPTLENLLIGWRIEAMKARRLADQYLSMSTDADRQRYGATAVYGQQGRQTIELAAVLERRVAAAEQGFIYCVLNDLAFEQKYPELVQEAKIQGRYITEWPMADHDGKLLLA